jgi:type II secretory pathway pseudopilin PulG
MTKKLTLIILAILLTIFTINVKKSQDKLDSLESTVESTNQQKTRLESELKNTKESDSQNQQKIQELEQKIQQLEADLQAKREHQRWLASLPNHERWMFQAGIPQDQWGAAYTLVNRESRWRPDVVNPSSGACGLAQSLPCSKIAKAGLDWKNPVHALQWQYKYVTERYGDYNKALAFWSCIGTCSSKLGTTSKVTTWY